jgi:hypothetical protein
MKLHEEFKLYENMWDDESSVDSAKLSDTIITALTKAFRHNDNILIEAPFNANAVGICEKWVSDKGRSMTRLSVMTETESELEIKLKQAYSRKHIVLLEDVERLKPRALSKLFAIICEDGSTEFTICVVRKALPFSSWTVRVFPVVVHGFTDEAIDESIDTEKIYKLSCTGSDLDDAIAMGKVPTYLKNVKEVELVDRDRVPVKKYNQICKMLADLGIKVTKGASGRETSGKVIKEAIGKTANEIINRYQDNVADHILELEHEKEFVNAEWFEDEWYILENVEVEPDYYQLIMDRPIKSIENADAIINYAFGPNVVFNILDVMSEGGVVFENNENWIYVERWVVEQGKTVTESSEFATQSERDFKKAFISSILKGHPERKAACETLNKFDFRIGDRFSLDIQNGVITLPQSIIKQDFGYKWLLTNLSRELIGLTAAMQKLTKLKDCLEDACIDLR